MRFDHVRAASFVVLVLILLPRSAPAHEWHQHSDESDTRSSDAIAGRGEQNKPSAEPLKERSTYILTGITETDDVDKAPQPEIARHFGHFKNVKTRWDSDTLFVESNGLPDHPMMVGIRNWQQQVPLPQPFAGSNAWKIPLHPKLAAKPINAKRTSFRGAIALAVNGVPIFSALNNRGVDAYLAGELDEWGGHCGRGDDYHYHIAPIHLEEIVGKGNPIAFALDGFPIFGLNEADGSPVGKLDELNGQFDADGNYHYHATKTYPYINGGVRGVVDYRNGEIASQPRDSPIRPGQSPLRGATITEFKTTDKQSVLTYKLRGQVGSIVYEPAGTSSFKFIYHEPDGNTWTKTYQRRDRNSRGESGGRRPPPRNRRPPRDARR